MPTAGETTRKASWSIRRISRRRARLAVVAALVATTGAGVTAYSDAATPTNPYAAACPALAPQLVFGNTGDCVKKLQWALNAVQNSGLKGTGNFGPVTQGEVKKFQAAHGIRNSGIVGPLTWGALDKALPGTTPATPAPTPAPTGPLTAALVKAWATAYKVAHPGRGGKDWDINTKSASQLAGDPAGRQLVGICGPHARPVIPMIAWEYGGSDHPWINPGASALVYCVYTPVKPSTSHWRYDAASNRVTADVWVLFPGQNPCRNRAGRDQVMACLGSGSNIEILVDTASLNDGAAAGLALAESTTTLRLIPPDGTTIPLYVGT